MDLDKYLIKSNRVFDREKVPLPPQSQWRARFSEYCTGFNLDIEVGCGVGLHPIQYSQKNSNRFLVALEHTENKFKSFERRIQNHAAIKNLVGLQANAISWITHELRDREVSRFIFLYPNPYPKEKDRSKRFYAMPFMSEVIKKLSVDGEIWFATNSPDYARETEFFLTQRFEMNKSEFRLLNQASLPPGFQPRSHFEKKYLLRGETCFDMVFKLPKKS